MKVYKENFFNRIFRQKKLQKQRDERTRLARIIERIDYYTPKLQECQDLNEMLQLHKNMWRDDIKSRTIGPTKYGIFRCKDIEEMTPEDVYLGNIYGLWTKNIPGWYKAKDEPFGVNSMGIEASTPLYQIVLHQYRSILTSNIQMIRQQNIDRLKELKT